MNTVLKRIISTIILILFLMYTMPVLALTNEEVIYSKMDTESNVYKSIVSTTTEGANGTENAQEDINKELPIKCTVKYELDGKEISAKEIAGKSGNVKVNLTFENTIENKVNINGKTERMYTPFIVVAGVIVNNENNKNVKVSSGKVINDGTKSIVVGYALPGMEESLNLKKKDIELPNSIEITMETTSFEMGDIISLYTSNLLGSVDLDKIYDKLDEIYDSVDKLKDGADKLQDGTISLRDGVSSLNDGAIKLNDGTNTLNNGTQELSKGISSLNSGTKTLGSGVQTLSQGINDANAGAQALSQGVNQVKSGSEELTNGMKTLDSEYTALDQGIQSIAESAESLPDAINKVSGGISGIGDGLNDLKTKLQGANENISALANGAANVNTGLNQISSIVENMPAQTTGTSVATLAVDNSASIDSINSAESLNSSAIGTLQGIQTTLDGLKNGENDAEIENKKAQIQAAIDNINSSNSSLEAAKTNMKTEVSGTTSTTITNPDVSTLKAVVASVSAGAANVSGGMQKLNSEFGGFISGTDKLIGGNANLANGFNQLSEPLKELSNNAGKLSSGSLKVKNGISELTNGSEKLNSGITEVNAGAEKLADGTNKLNNGATTLAGGANSLISGVNKLNEGGEKLANGSNELANATNSLKDGTGKLLDGANELTDGMVKFNKEGITKIYNTVNGDVKGIVNRLKTLEELGREYNKFGSDTERNEIKFITIIDSIKNSKKEETNEEVILDNEEVDIKKNKEN